MVSNLSVLPNLPLGILFVVMASIIGSVGALYLKLVSRRLADGWKSLFQSYHLYLGLFLYGVSALVFVYALRYGELSSLYPVAGLAYVWVALLSRRYLGEKINDIKWLGILCIVIALVLISFSG